MKELFGTNETENRKNTECDGAKYCTLNIGHGISDEINKTAEKLERIEEKGKLPFALYIVAWILFGTGFNIAGLFVVDILFDGFDSIKSVIGFFIGGVISLVIGGGMLLYEKYKTQANIGRKEYKKANDDLEKRISIYTAQLGIPSDAEKINVFLYNYKIKNGETVIKEEFTGHFINYEAYVFNEAECLCISDLEYRFDIPLSDIKDFGVEEKRHTLPAGRRINRRPNTASKPTTSNALCLRPALICCLISAVKNSVCIFPNMKCLC